MVLRIRGTQNISSCSIHNNGAHIAMHKIQTHTQRVCLIVFLNYVMDLVLLGSMGAAVAADQHSQCNQIVCQCSARTCMCVCADLNALHWRKFHLDHFNCGSFDIWSIRCRWTKIASFTLACLLFFELPHK